MSSIDHNESKHYTRNKGLEATKGGNLLLLKMK